MSAHLWTTCTVIMCDYGNYTMTEYLISLCLLSPFSKYSLRLITLTLFFSKWVPSYSITEQILGFLQYVSVLLCISLDTASFWSGWCCSISPTKKYDYVSLM